MFDRIRKYLFGDNKEKYEEIENEDEYLGIGAVCDTKLFSRLENEVNNNE